MQTKTDFKILERYEVIGQGDMIDSPRQIDGWWVTPAQEYHGNVPVEIRRKLVEFLQLGIPVQGFVIAQDIREVKPNQLPKPQPRHELPAPTVKVKTETPKREESSGNGLGTAIGLIFAPAVIVMMGFAWLIGAALSYDPMLIAILDDGRWICLGVWYD
jgi:hypothetical protein